MERDPALTRVDFGGQEHDWVVAENAHFLPRARVVSSAVVEPDDESAWTMLGDEDFDLEQSIVLADGDALDGGGAPAGSARLVASEADHVAVGVDVERPGYLVLSDTFFPGWSATVDGEEREIHRANVAFRAVRLAPGDTRVDFRYRPVSFRVGAWLSLGGLSVAAILALFGGARTGRRGRPTWGQWYLWLLFALPGFLAVAG